MEKVDKTIRKGSIEMQTITRTEDPQSSIGAASLARRNIQTTWNLEIEQAKVAFSNAELSIQQGLTYLQFPVGLVAGLLGGRLLHTVIGVFPWLIGFPLWLVAVISVLVVIWRLRQNPEPLRSLAVNTKNFIQANGVMVLLWSALIALVLPGWLGGLLFWITMIAGVYMLAKCALVIKNASDNS